MWVNSPMDRETAIVRGRRPSFFKTFFIYQDRSLNFGAHIWREMICIYVGENLNGCETAHAGDRKAKVPPFHNFFIHQDRRLKFDMHIVHEKRNTIIRICVDQLTQEIGNG